MEMVVANLSNNLSFGYLGRMPSEKLHSGDLPYAYLVGMGSSANPRLLSFDVEPDATEVYEDLVVQGLWCLPR